MKVKVLKNFVPEKSDKTRKAGEVFEVTSEYGKQLIGNGYAEELKQEVKEFSISKKSIVKENAAEFTIRKKSKPAKEKLFVLPKKPNKDNKKIVVEKSTELYNNK